MTCVLDASMALSFVLKDEHTTHSARVLKTVAREGATVPALWRYEVFNALRFAERRSRISPAAMTNAIRGLEQLPVETDSRPIDGIRLTTVARDFDLSVYDAAYLALSLDLNLPLASLDAGLMRSAKTAGVALVK